MKERCTLCSCESEDLTHLTLYVIGSEGINVCLPCRIFLSNCAKGIMESAGRVKSQTIKDIRGFK